MSRKRIDFKTANSFSVRWVVAVLKVERKKGRYICGVCEKPALKVSDSGYGWYCHGCCVGGTALELVKHLEGLADIYDAAVWVLNRVGVDAAKPR